MINKFTFGLLSGIQTLSFTLSIFSLFWSNISVFQEMSWWFFLIIIALLILENIYDLFLFNLNNSYYFRSKIIGLIIFSVLLYLLFSFPFTKEFPQSFVPTISNIIPVCILLVSSILSYFVRFPIFYRSQIYNYIDQSSSMTLMEAFNQERLLITSSFNQALSLRNSSIFLIIFITLVFCGNSIVSTNKLFFIVNYLITIISAFGIYGLANIFIEEHRFYSFGSATSIYYKKEKLNTAIILITISTFLCLLISQNSALFQNVLTTVLNSYKEYIVNSGKNLPAIFATPPDTKNSLLDFSVMPRPDKDSISPEMVFVFICVLLFFILIILSVIYLIQKIRHSKIHIFKSFILILKQIRDAFIEQLINFFRFLKSLFTLKNITKNSTPKTQVIPISPREYIKRMVSNEKSKQNKKYYSEVVKIYLAYLQWASKLGITWLLSDTPFDIANKSLVVLKDQLSNEDFESIKKTIYAITEMLEIDLFSQNQLTKSEVDSMRKLTQGLSSYQITKQ